jgi:hypothetical protein
LIQDKRIEKQEAPDKQQAEFFRLLKAKERVGKQEITVQ